MKTIPLYDATVPVACTISGPEVQGRVELIERMRGNLSRLERTEHGLLLHFPSNEATEADLRRFAVDEKRCCEFWGFDVITERGLALRWDAPPEAAGILDRIASFLLGTEPALDLADLL